MKKDLTVDGFQSDHDVANKFASHFVSINQQQNDTKHIV
jgi:hypothetical protein